jgi:hypothetical protein
MDRFRSERKSLVDPSESAKKERGIEQANEPDFRLAARGEGGVASGQWPVKPKGGS